MPKLPFDDKSFDLVLSGHFLQEEFINIAAHELRTPIQPILGISQLLRYKSKDPQSIESLDIVIRNATRLKRLTEDILDVQKDR